jgi:hypothetical protein
LLPLRPVGWCWVCVGCPLCPTLGPSVLVIVPLFSRGLPGASSSFFAAGFHSVFVGAVPSAGVPVGVYPVARPPRLLSPECWPQLRVVLGPGCGFYQDARLLTGRAAHCSGLPRGRRWSARGSEDSDDDIVELPRPPLASSSLRAPSPGFPGQEFVGRFPSAGLLCVPLCGCRGSQPCCRPC